MIHYTIQFRITKIKSEPKAGFLYKNPKASKLLEVPFFLSLWQKGSNLGPPA